MFNRFRNLRVFNTFKPLGNKPSLPSSLFRPNITSGRFPDYHNEGSSSYQQLFQENKEKVIQKTKELVNLVVQATKEAYKDAKYLTHIRYKSAKKDYTVQELLEITRIKKDLMKFIPYSAAMTLPGGFALLAFITAFFPHGTPTYFMSEQKIKEQQRQYLENQAKAHGKLMDYLLAAMEKEGYNPSNRNVEDMKKFFSEHKEALLEGLDTKKMDSDTLKYASDFLMFEYVEGTYILNTVYRTLVNLPRYGYNLGMWIARNSYRAVWTHPFFNYQFKLNVTPFEEFKEELIRHQLEKQLQLLRAENEALVKNKIGEVKEEDFLKLAQERGHHATSEEDAKKWLEKEWNPVAKKALDNEMFTFWYSVMEYGEH